MNRPTGALHDPRAAPRGRPIGFMPGMRARGDLPEEVDNRKHAKRRVNQTDEGCVGHALGGGARARADAMGFELDVSDRGIYKGALQFDDPKATKLVDGGSFPEKAVDWIQTFGIVSRDRCPEDSDVTEPLGEDVLEAGSIALVTGVYRIDSGGETKRAAIMKACSQKHFIPFAMDVDTSYETYRGGVWTGPTGEKRGGHAQFAAGYTPEGVRVVNSWGGEDDPDPWGDDGTSIIAWPFFLKKTRSLFVVTFAPKVVL